MTDDDPALLLTFLRGRDVPCPLCRYNLRDLSAPRCPECGRELKLSVGMTEPYLAAWMVLAIALIGSGGFGLFCIMMVIKGGWPSWDARGRVPLNVTFLFHMITAPLAALAIFYRRRFMRQPQQTQWTIAVATAVVCAASFTTFMCFVR